jgi:exodeoxyribonuclease X
MAKRASKKDSGPLIPVIDTETTGDDETAQVIEFAAAYVNLGEMSIDAYTAERFKPTVDMNVVARAVHHITDADLADRPLVTEARPKDLVDGAMWAAHNIKFDARLLKQTWPAWESGPQICTFRCARHIWPLAPKHSNQVLRYWLGLDVHPSALALPPHSALHDALVTGSLLIRELHERNFLELIELTQTPILLPVCPMGDFKGKPWNEVTMGMLQWILDLPDADSDLAYTAQHWKDKPDREPILLVDCSMGKHKGKTWEWIAKNDSGYLYWIRKNGTFDSDTIHTVNYWLNPPLTIRAGA